MRVKAAALVCLLTVQGYAQAQEQGVREPGRRYKITEQLNLSEAQRQALSDGHHGKSREIRRNLLDEREKLNKMVRDRGVPDDAIRQQYGRVNSMEQDWNSRRLEGILRARKVLDERQMQKLFELHREQHHKR
jgi:Spy/CpxP family protein refolding chaperone